MFKKKEKKEKVKKQKKGFFKKKKKEDTLHNQNEQINEQILKNQIKNELIREVNSAFISNLKNEIKRDLKKELLAQINVEVLNSIKNGLREKIKKELKDELTDEIKKDILLDIQIKQAREKSLREKIAKNNKHVEPIKVSDEELIRHFLASEDFKEQLDTSQNLERSLILEIKKEEVKVSQNKGEEIAIAKTEILEDDRTLKLDLDRTEFDMSAYNDEEIFFENMKEDVDSNFKDSIKAFAKEQGENLKKAGADIKGISKKGYELSKDELEKIKNSEAFKNYAEKIRKLKNKNNP